jgi:hypothetical protein
MYKLPAEGNCYDDYWKVLKPAAAVIKDYNQNMG